MWKSGSGSQNRSSSVSSQRSTTARAVRVSASWEMRQPLGSAVVPDVYISTPTSRIRVADAARRTTSGGTVVGRREERVAVDEAGRRALAEHDPQERAAGLGDGGVEERDEVDVLRDDVGRQHRGRVRVAQDVGELVGLVARVDEQRAGAEQRAREEGVDEGRAVGHQDGDDVAAPDPVRVERPRDALARPRTSRRTSPASRGKTTASCSGRRAALRARTPPIVVEAIQSASPTPRRGAPRSHAGRLARGVREVGGLELLDATRHLRGGAAKDDLPALHHEHVVGDAERLLDVLLDEEDADARLVRGVLHGLEQPLRRPAARARARARRSAAASARGRARGRARASAAHRRRGARRAAA